jgi:hypothetical protein
MENHLLNRLPRASTGWLLLAAGFLLLVVAVVAAAAKSWGVASLGGVLALALLSIGALTPDKLSRVLAAFAIAPLAPAVAIAIQSGQPQSALLAAPYAYFFSMLSVPAYLVLRRRRWSKLWQVLGASAVLGALAGYFTFAGEGLVHETLLFACYGTLTGAVFWLIAFLGVPSTQGTSSPPNGSNAV